MDPAVAGFLMLVNSMVMLVPAFSELPPDRVMVITFPETVTVSVPSKLVPASPMAVAPPLLMVKPAGRVMTIFPSAGSALAKVNVTSTLPTAPATKLSGCTLVPVRSPITVFTAVWESPKVAVEERGNIGTTAELMLAVAARGNFGKNVSLILVVAPAVRGKLTITPELMLAVAARGKLGGNVELIFPVAAMLRG